jgi:hypothetical protein
MGLVCLPFMGRAEKGGNLQNQPDLRFPEYV